MRFNVIFCYFFQFWYFIKAYCLGAYYLIFELQQKCFGAAKVLKLNDLPVLRDRVAIITGGASGIGLEVVKTLLLLGIHVFIGAPVSMEDCGIIKNKLGSESSKFKIQVWPLDLSSFESVRTFARTFLETAKPLHLLINNAGVMYVPYRKTVDGFEEHFQVNYLGHCLLTKLLLPKLKECGSENLYGRIVNVSSSTHFVGNINFEDLHSEKCYSRYYGYLQSKLAIVLHTYSLQKEMESSDSFVTVNCIHPGVVHTNLYKNVWWAKYVGKYLFKSPKEGAQTVLFVAVSPSIEGVGGKYFEECEIIKSSDLSYDVVLQNKLRQVTEEFLKAYIP